MSLLSTLELCLVLVLKTLSLNDANKFQTPPSSRRLPGHLQGVYQVQKDELSHNVSLQGVRPNVKYDDVYIGPTFISKWGECIGTLGRSYILRARQTNSSACFRCLTILERTPNVLQVLTSHKNTCYKSEAAARADCKPLSPETPGEGIMLWRSEDVQYQLCPISGVAELTYRVSDSFQQSLPGYEQFTVGNCKYGYQLDVQTKEGKTMFNGRTFKCLGKWPSAKNNGEEYFAIYDQLAHEFRCGIYLEEDGISHAALSIDSSCSNLLLNSTDGYETVTIRPVHSEISWPAMLKECSFPIWIQGVWEYMVIQPKMMTYYRNNDPSSMIVAFAKCIRVDEDKMQVFSKTHCNEAIGYQCLHFKRRSSSVIEIKHAKEGYQEYSPTFCMDDRVFADLSWAILSVINPTAFVACSFAGRYASKQEEAAGKKLCYSFSTDCNRSDQLTKTTFYCQTGELLNVLRFDCLASWKEDEYYFDYVKLKDTSRRGCFASRLSNGKLYVVWTGKECQRNVDFEKLEEEYDEKLMILRQQEYCAGKGTDEDGRSSTSRGNSIRPPKTTALPLQQSLAILLYMFIYLFLKLCDEAFSPPDSV